MDPLWASVAEFWWIGPAVVGSGALGFFGLRRQRTATARRLEYDAARHDLRRARSNASDARVAAKVARAELARVKAQRDATRATGADVAAARTDVQRAQREAKAASADVRARRAQVTAARVSLPRRAADPASLPLGRLMATHDTLTARWMAYETDPTSEIAFPMMTDVREPLTAAFLEAQRAAQWLRPSSPQARMLPADYAAYRDAVRHEYRAFDAAEAEAYRRARATGAIPPGPRPETPADRWSIVTRTIAQTVIASSADAAVRLTETVTARVTRDAAKNPTPPPTAKPQSPKAPRPQPVWPVPSRDRRTTDPR